ncbi:hypothetical protein OAO18_06375 [Francisellaceae bacterium]|nr:hypothetical protein [Francisellaceae bacterium]
MNNNFLNKYVSHLLDKNMSNFNIRDLIENPTKIEKIPEVFEERVFAKKDIKNLVYPKAMDAVVFQKINISITQLDENLVQIDDTKLEINSIFIDELEVDLKPWGFVGKTIFSLPYETQVPDKYQILFQNKPLKIDVKIDLDYKNDMTYDENKGKSVNSTLSLTAISEPSSGSIRHHGLDYSKSYSQDKQEFLSERTTFELDFKDMLNGTWSNHWGVCVATDITLESFFATENEPYESFVSLDFDESAHPTTNTQRPMIVMNCSINDDFSLYDMLIETLKRYGLSLFYNYDNSNYIVADAISYLSKLGEAVESNLSYSRYIKKASMRSSGILKPDIEKLVSVKASISEKFEKNPIEQFGESSLEVNSGLGTYAYTSSLSKKEDFSNLLKKKTQCFFNPYTPRLKLYDLPAPLYDIDFLPLNKVKFDDKINIINLNKGNLPELVYIGGKIKFNSSFLWGKYKKITGITREHINSEGNVELIKNLFSNDNSKYRPDILFDSNIEMDFIHESDFLTILPKILKEQKALPVISEIFTTEQDIENGKQNHLLVNGYENSETKADDNSNGSFFSENSWDYDLSHSYSLSLPKCLRRESDENDKLILIPIDMYKVNFNPNIYSLLKSGTTLKIDLFFDSIDVKQIYDYSIPASIYSNGSANQSSYINFENNEDMQSYIMATHALEDNSHSLTVESSLNDQCRRVTLNNKFLKISYKLKG